MTNDPVERIVANALDKAGVEYSHGPLDFECDGFAIECKRFWSDRIKRQIEHRTDVILVQGIEAAQAFKALVGA